MCVVPFSHEAPVVAYFVPPEDVIAHVDNLVDNYSMLRCRERLRPFNQRTCGLEFQCSQRINRREIVEIARCVVQLGHHP